MERIAPEIRRELARFGPQAGMAALVEAWPGAVGEPIARHAWPARIGRDGTLHVATSSSAWAFELSHLEQELVGRLRAAVLEPAVPRLRFAVGPLLELAPLREAEPVEESHMAPSAEQRAEAERLAARIGAEGLRAAVAEAAAQSLARAGSGR